MSGCINPTSYNTKLRCFYRDRAKGLSNLFTCLECGAGPCKLSTPTQIAPATDELIESLERALTERDISTAYSDHVLALIARIKAEREQTIRECAEIALNEPLLLTPADGPRPQKRIHDKILALLTNKGEPR